jgi:Asp/Glu/hydantoin racemase
MLRIRAITPIHVDGEELRRRQQRYDRLAPEGIEIHLDDIGDDPEVPRSLENEDDVRRSEALVVAEIRRTDQQRYDAVLPDCVLDPGVGVVPDAPVPVVGLLSLSTHFLAGAGQRFAAVTRNPAIAEELRRKAGSYGLGEALTDVRVLGLSVEDISDDRTWAEAITRAVAGLPVGAVVNGCSAVDVRVAGSGPRIVDPTAVALRVLGLGDELDVVSGPEGALVGS